MRSEGWLEVAGYGIMDASLHACLIQRFENGVA
jgi:hypothetical protein